MPNNKRLGHFSRLTPAILNSLAGIKAAYKHEMAFRQEVFLFTLLLPVAVYLANSFIEFALLLSAMVAVLVTELLNSAIEAVVDRIGLERHELSGRAKDLGSAAVFVAISYFIFIWGYKLFTLL